MHTFKGWGNSASGSVWQIGLPTSKMIYSGTSLIYSETSAWSPSAAISDNLIRNPSWYAVGGIIDQHIYVPLLITKSVTRDNKTYTTSYGNYDSYGNAETVTESGDISRTTSVDYYWTNAAKNIVQNKPHKVTITGSYPGSFATTYTYDNNSGNVSQVIRYGVKTDYFYDGSGNLDYLVDANTKTTRFDWSWGRISSKQNPIYTVTRSINPNGTIANETDGRGSGYTTIYGYDNNLRLRSITPPTGYGNVTNIDYPSDNSNSYKNISRGGYYKKTNYDGFGRTIGTIDGKGITTTIAYTGYGPKSYETSNVGDTVNYDFFGRVVSTVHRDGSSIVYSYLNSDVTVRDEEFNNTTFTYAAFGNPDEKLLLKVTDALPAHNVTQYGYNILGSLTSISQGGTTRSYVYDLTTNFLTSETHPDRGTISYPVRDSVGNIKTKVEPSGTTTFDYDDINRLTNVHAGSASVSYTYDNADNRKTMDNAGANIDYVFDNVNRLHQKTEVIGARTYVTTYDYDANDNLEYITYPSGATRMVHYTYDANNQATSASGLGSNIVNNISYYTSVPNIGLPHVYTYANGHAVTFSYNNRNMTTGITAGTDALNIGFGYGDPRGNTTTITNYLNHTEDKVLTYDELNRLRTLNAPWGGYTYDSLGNRQTKAFGSNSTTYTYTSNRLTAATSGETYQYDNGDGDLTSINNGSRSFIYDLLHNMTQFKQNGTPVADYTYDGDGMRMTKVAGGKTTVYHYDQSGHILTENDENGNYLSDYVYLHGKLVAKIAEGSTVPPMVPQSLSVNSVTSSQVTLAWIDNSTNETGFVIERKLGAAGTYSPIVTTAQNVSSFTDTMLPQNTLYYYRLKAVNQAGDSAYIETNTTTLILAAPSNLAALPASPTSISLAWSDNASDETGFEVWRKTGTAGSYAQIGTVSSNVKVYQDSGLTLGMDYYYKVRAYTSSNFSNWTNEAGTILAPPAAPQNLSVTSVTFSRATLSWQDNSTNETGFVVERKLGTTGTYAPIVTTLPNVMSITDTGLMQNSSYYYQVKATNGVGDSAYIETNTTTLIWAAPTNLILSGATSTSIKLTWTYNASDETGFEVWRKTGVSGTYAPLGTVDSNTTTYLDAGLPPGTEYYYQVRAYAQPNVSLWSNEVHGHALSRYTLSVAAVRYRVEGIIQSTPAGISCGVGCSESQSTYEEGTIVTLREVTAHNGFGGWSGGGCSGVETCVVALNSDTTVTANLNLVGDQATAMLNRLYGPKSANCSTCHVSDSSSKYATDLLSQLNTGLAIYEMFRNIEQLDSDGDGFTNLIEFINGTAPWDLLSHPVISASISINAGAAYTTTAAVNLTLACSDGSACSQMQFSNDNVNWSATEAYISSKTWTLSPGEGAKTVYGKFTGPTGAVGTATATITLDQCASWPVSIAGPPRSYYLTLQAAYDAAPDGALIQMRNLGFVQNFNANRDNISASLEGGKTCDYLQTIGATTLKGMITTSAGTLTIRDFVLQP